MKFVILSTGNIPGYNVRGPVLSPMEYDIHEVLRWLNMRVDVREYMEDGSYRKLRHDDPKLMELLNEKCDKKMKEKKELRSELLKVNEPRPMGNVKLKPEKKKEQPKIKAKLVKREEKLIEEPKVEEQKEEKNELLLDELEKPE